jgi:hypothetical protein
VDLVKPLGEEAEEDALDEEELVVLREAGVIAKSDQKRNRRKSKAGHIVFADSEEQGLTCIS